MSVTMAMPEVGLEVTPTRPTMRDDTVTKRKAKTAMQTAAMRRKSKGAPPPRAPGTRARSRMIAAVPPSTTAMGRSFSVRRSDPLTPRRPRAISAPRPSRSEATMMGSDLATAMRPAVATAPAPT